MRILKSCPSVRTPRKEFTPGFINVSPTVVIATTMKMYLQVLQHRNTKTYLKTTYIFMFQQVCIIEPSFIKTTSGMHRRLFEGRHLVFLVRCQ